MVGFYPVDEPQNSVICVLVTSPTVKSLYGRGFTADVLRGLIGIMTDN